MINSPQDFVDQLNLKIMPEMGYSLKKEDDYFYWFWGNEKRYPANQKTREYVKNLGYILGKG